MRRRRERKPTLLGEAFAMKESRGWESTADNIHIQQNIERQRRNMLLVIALTLLVLGCLAVMLFWVF